jgi:alpha,alpha-trehalose phosphorylase
VRVALADQGPLRKGKPSLADFADQRREDGSLLSASVPAVTTAIPVVGMPADAEHGADA